MANPPEYIGRPEPGKPLYTIRIENHVEGTGFEIKVFQSTRLNQVIAETFGRRSKPHGMDTITKELRKRLVVRWLHE